MVEKKRGGCLTRRDIVLILVGLVPVRVVVGVTHGWEEASEDGELLLTSAAAASF